MDKSKWEYKKLGEVASFERGLTYSKIDESDSSTKGVLRSNNIDLDSHQLVFDEIKWLNESFEIPQSKKLAKDSIFICMSNGSKAHLGKVAFVDKDYDYAFGGFMGMIKPLNIYPKYLFYYFLSKEYRDGLEQIGKGANINNLRFAQLANFMIPNPVTDDQQRIVAELDCLNEMIALKQEQLKEFDKLAQSIFYDMFGDGNWKSRKIKDIAKVKIGPFGSSLHQYDYITGGTPLVNPIHMINGKIVVDNDFTITEEKKTELTSYLLKTNDIVFGRRGDIGRCALVTDKENGYLCGTGSMFVRFDIDIDPTYALCELSSKEIKKYLLDNAKGATMLNINGGIVENIPVPLPPLALQQQFAEKIQAIEAQKELVKQSIAETQQLLDSRMDYYFN